jgi:hypothetical protein
MIRKDNHIKTFTALIALLLLNILVDQFENRIIFSDNLLREHFEYKVEKTELEEYIKNRKNLKFYDWFLPSLEVLFKCCFLFCFSLVGFALFRYPIKKITLLYSVVIANFVLVTPTIISSLYFGHFKAITSLNVYKDFSPWSLNYYLDDFQGLPILLYNLSHVFDFFYLITLFVISFIATKESNVPLVKSIRCDFIGCVPFFLVSFILFVNLKMFF